MFGKLKEIPDCLLQGDHIHCRPVKNRPMVEAVVVRTGEEIPVTDKVIVCPVRSAASCCLLRAKMSDPHCLYPSTKYIIGPGMAEKKMDGYI